MALSLANLPGVVGWWSPRLSPMRQLSTGVTDVAAGDPVGWVRNLAGDAYPLIQATAAFRFTYRAAGINGLPAWELDGVDDWMASDALAALFTGSDKPLTLAMVVSVTSPTANQTHMSLAQTVALHVLRTNATARIESLRRDDGNVTVTVTAPDTAAGKIVAATPAVLLWRFAGTTTDLWKDGSQRLAPTSQDVASVTVNQMTFGALRGGTVSQYVPGFYGDIVLFNAAASDATILQVFRSLNAVYGIASA